MLTNIILNVAHDSEEYENNNDNDHNKMNTTTIQYALRTSMSNKMTSAMESSTQKRKCTLENGDSSTIGSFKKQGIERQADDEIDHIENDKNMSMVICNIVDNINEKKLSKWTFFKNSLNKPETNKRQYVVDNDLMYENVVAPKVVHDSRDMLYHCCNCRESGYFGEICGNEFCTMLYIIKY
jgi:hypothetical protein